MKKWFLCISLIVSAFSFSCEKDAPAELPDNRVFDFNFQVYDPSKSGILIRRIPSDMEFYIKGSYESAKLAKDIMVTCKIDNQDIKANYFGIEYNSDPSKPLVYLGKRGEVFRFGDSFTFNSDKLVANKVVFVIFLEGMPTGQMNVMFDVTWNGVTKSVSKSFNVR